MKNPKQNVTPESQNDLVTVSKKQDKLTSLELVNQINLFRDNENKNNLAHADLLKIIRDEFDIEIAEGKISEGYYLDKNNQRRPMFILTFLQAKQILFRESKLVRKAMFEYLDRLDQDFKTKGYASIDNKPRYTFEQSIIALTVAYRFDNLLSLSHYQD